MFEVLAGQKLPFEASFCDQTHLLDWTTTPWTLPSNTALTVGSQIEYALVATYNQYTFEPMQVVLAKNLVSYQFSKGFALVQDVAALANYEKGAKQIPYVVLDTCLGKELLDLRYAQLLPYAQPA